jgi:hypothetical protein
MSIVAALQRRLEKAVAKNPQTSDGSAGIVVCECNAWKGYMIQAMRPQATRVKLRPGAPAERVLAAVPASTRAVVMHIDASLTTDFLGDEAAFRSELAERGIAAVNLRATDIRKRTLHRQCAALGLASARAAREGPPDERLIIKTTLNAGGAPERKLVRRWGAAGERFAAELSRFVGGPLEYVVCRRADVSAAVWSDPTLVVERFVENPEGVFLRVSVAGPASIVTQAWSDYTIKKLSLPVRDRINYCYWTTPEGAHTPIGRTTEAAGRAVAVARRLLANLHVDMGAADCVMDADGAIVPIDVNKTPYWTKKRIPGFLEHLQHGLDHVIPAP